MKKIACILLSAAILSSMSAHASAKDVSAESGMDPASMQLAEAKTSVEKAPDQRLAEVASKVKAALDIGDEYKEFTGNLMENELVPQWSLEWSTESETLSVEAFENGQVTSYYFYEKDAAYPTHAFSPSFPSSPLMIPRSCRSSLSRNSISTWFLSPISFGPYRYSASVSAFSPDLSPR